MERRARKECPAKFRDISPNNRVSNGKNMESQMDTRTIKECIRGPLLVEMSAVRQGRAWSAAPSFSEVGFRL